MKRATDDHPSSQNKASLSYWQLALLASCLLLAAPTLLGLLYGLLLPAQSFAAPNVPLARTPSTPTTDPSGPTLTPSTTSIPTATQDPEATDALDPTMTPDPLDPPSPTFIPVPCEEQPYPDPELCAPTPTIEPTPTPTSTTIPTPVLKTRLLWLPALYN